MGARTLSFALASGGGPHLKELNLAFTDIGDTGVTEIGREGRREGGREGRKGRAIVARVFLLLSLRSDAFISPFFPLSLHLPTAKALHNGLLLPLPPSSPSSSSTLPLPPFLGNEDDDDEDYLGGGGGGGGAAAAAAAAVEDDTDPLLSLAAAAAAAATAGAATGGMALLPSLPPSLLPNHNASLHTLYPPEPACPRLETLVLAGCGVGDAGMTSTCPPSLPPFLPPSLPPSLPPYFACLSATGDADPGWVWGGR